jgi:F-type H+-transporting ATPase subunit b
VEQEEILARAKREIEDERARAIESLRREAVDLAVAAASKLVEKRLDSQEDRRIVTEFLSHVEKGAAVGSRS